MSIENARVRELVTTLGMQPHPEGGWYSEVFRSKRLVQPKSDLRGERSALTSIYFLLEVGQHSAWHVVQSDEVWMHLEGQPLDLWTWNATENIAVRHVLGPVGAIARPQYTVPAGLWQAARPAMQTDGPGFALVACAVGPGFEFVDFEMMKPAGADAAKLAQGWPQLAAFIPS